MATKTQISTEGQPRHAPVAKLDIHARQRGVTRQALIKMWLADRLEATV